MSLRRLFCVASFEKISIRRCEHRPDFRRSLKRRGLTQRQVSHIWQVISSAVTASKFPKSLLRTGGTHTDSQEQYVKAKVPCSKRLSCIYLKVRRQTQQSLLGTVWDLEGICHPGKMTGCYLHVMVIICTIHSCPETQWQGQSHVQLFQPGSLQRRGYNLGRRGRKREVLFSLTFYQPISPFSLNHWG